ncbi:unnamed protein product [Lactuca saligna]|uniref:Uncharacterized protein n=1 Tax=Lactuca saligna TaxID=75948 RepID=A0AA35VBZ5_LACSI|nr:unnamed protein product [Lactuca saligna]
MLSHPPQGSSIMIRYEWSVRESDHLKTADIRQSRCGLLRPPLPFEAPSSVAASLGIAAVPAPLPEPMCTVEMAAKIDDRAENVATRFVSHRKPRNPIFHSTSLLLRCSQ